MKLTFLTTEENAGLDLSDPLFLTEKYDPQEYRFGIRYDDNTLVGVIFLFNFMNQCRKAEIGLMIFPEHRNPAGERTAYKAFKEFIPAVFEIGSLNRIYARVHADNKPCLSCIERLGFKYEGTERQTLLVNGVFKDIKVFSIIKNDLKE